MNLQKSKPMNDSMQMKEGTMEWMNMTEWMNEWMNEWMIQYKLAWRIHHGCVALHSVVPLLFTKC